MALKSTGTGADKIASGTTNQRPGSPETGQLRYNSTTKAIEVWTGSEWLAGRPDLPNDGELNFTIGRGIELSGATQATMNQSKNTTTTFSFDEAWGDSKYGCDPPADGFSLHCLVSFRGSDVRILSRKNVAMVQKVRAGELYLIRRVVFTNPSPVGIGYTVGFGWGNYSPSGTFYIAYNDLDYRDNWNVKGTDATRFDIVGNKDQENFITATAWVTT